MQGFRVGSIWGFEIRIDFSWVIIFWLVLWTLSSGLFPAQFPQLQPATHVGMGIAGTILFFASLVAHEISHSLVARAKGISVESITLFIFGGVARTRKDAESPGDEFQIAVVGPLTSIALSGWFGMIWWLGQQGGWSVAITGVAAYLSSINLIIALFNLLPGFPLDGGRVFRALVWKITGSQTLATRIASMSGKVFGYFIVFLGFLQVFRSNFLGGLWLILIGWFLSTTAELSYQELLLRTGLDTVKAVQVMTPHPETVSPNLTLQELVDDYFLRQRYQAFPVVESGQPIGLITLHQVKEVPRYLWAEQTVRSLMTPLEKTVVVCFQDQMLDVLKKMAEADVQRALVIEAGNLEGIITATDITSWLRRVQDLEALRKRERGSK
jgi:Zn-dependent protease/CBS domain-containing protein